EYVSVSADAESQRDNSSQGKARGLNQHAKAEAEVLQHSFRDMLQVCLRSLLPGLIDSAKGDQCLAARLAGGHTASHVLLNLLLQMELQLVGEIIAVRFAKEAGPDSFQHVLRLSVLSS